MAEPLEVAVERFVASVRREARRAIRKGLKIRLCLDQGVREQPRGGFMYREPDGSACLTATIEAEPLPEGWSHG